MTSPNLEPPVSENRYGRVRGSLRWARETWGKLSLTNKVMLGGFAVGTAAGVAAGVVFEPSFTTVLKSSATGGFVGLMVGLELESSRVLA